MKLGQIMTRTVETCCPTDSIATAAQKMKAHDCGALPVVDEGQRVVGVVTDRDLIVRGVAAGTSSSDLTVADCMTNQVISATPEMDAHKAADLMANHQIRRLVVLDGDRLAGMVALGDMALQQIHVDEAGGALSGISEHSHPEGQS
ncbi:MAG TPA: CBS domain-containing protein [Symbiobacteriaceae bacterium]|nr:CBS domain-containing protein [Symbiobacteriaceae bacterium]